MIPGWASISPCGGPRPAPRQGVLADGQCAAPLGHTMPDEHKQALMALLNRHQVPLVEDDVVWRSSMSGVSGQGHHPLGCAGRACCAALTKCLAGLSGSAG